MKKKMTKWLAVTTATIMLISLTACNTQVVDSTASDASEVIASEEGTSEEAETIEITAKPDNPLEVGAETAIEGRASNGAEVTYLTSDSNIASVDKTTGKITGVSSGYATITVRASGCESQKMKIAIVVPEEENADGNTSQDSNESDSASGLVSASGSGSATGNGSSTTNKGGSSGGNSSGTTAAPAGAATEATTEAATEAATETPQGYFTSDGAGIVDLINNGCMQERAGDLNPDGSVTVAGSVYWDASLAALAQERAKEIAINYSHSSAGGYNAGCGENIGMGGTTSVSGWYDNWYNSPGHKNTMMISGGCGYACYVYDGVAYAVYLVR